jgi:RHS repeat-associated protein
VSSNTYYLFPHYEVKQSGTATPVVTKYYYFGGLLIAKREGGVLTYLHSDQLGSVVLETDTNGNLVNDQRYYAYGRRLDTGGSISGEVDFTSQPEDATGLLYYNARYYDPQLGQFISPDTIVPDPTQLIDYNRYLYARGNPVKYNDPSGHYSIDELQEHFGVNSFDELMALFEEGGDYEGLEGWYDVLRFAQDGDTVIATNNLAQLSLTGTFMRSAQGKIQIDMGEQGIAPESLFAQFGGVIRHGPENSIIGIGAYELRGQEYVWRNAIVGGRRHGDMQSCDNVDCIAVAIDGVGIAGAGLQAGSAICGPYAGVCYKGGGAISGIATVVGWGYTAINTWRGNATAADLAVTTVTAGTGLATKNPKVNLGAGVAQFIWDKFVSPLQR